MSDRLSEEVARFQSRFTALKAEVGKVLVGQDDMLHRLLLGLLAGGHILLEGVPGLPKRKGRHPVLDEAQDTALWEHWKAGVTERHIALDDELSMLGLTMDLAEAMTLPMSVVWAAIRNWIDQGLV